MVSAFEPRIRAVEKWQAGDACRSRCARERQATEWRQKDCDAVDAVLLNRQNIKRTRMFNRTWPPRVLQNILSGLIWSPSGSSLLARSLAQRRMNCRPRWLRSAARVMASGSNSPMTASLSPAIAGA